MAIPQYLAMTAAEMQNCPRFPAHIGWMACHFSPYGTGLSNLPQSLPEDSLLILNDRTPIFHHDPVRIAEELAACIEAFRCRGLLLDFQRPGNEELSVLVQTLQPSLPCPVAVSDLYAADAECAVFLPPVPLHLPLGEYISPWQNREIWLEMAPDCETITITEQGALFTGDNPEEIREGGFADETLHCHYQISTEEDQIRFQLHRSREDLEALAAEAEAYGVTNAVGLYQQFPFDHFG